MGPPRRRPSASQPGRQRFPPPFPPLSRRRQHPRGPRKPLVLIADDMQDARDIYAAYLEVRGFRAVTARDGEQAVEVATSERPDVIVMDLTMPKMDGIEATRRIKRNPRTRKIPVIMLTGYGQRAIEGGALEAGAAVFLTKPCPPDELEAAVRRLLDRPAEPS